MMFSYSGIDDIMRIGSDSVNELVVENQQLFRELIKDISLQIAAGETNSKKAVLSENDALVNWAKCSEIILRFVPFDLDKKTLLSKICARLEQESVSETNYTKTAKLLSELEAYIYDLSFNLSCDLRPAKLSFANILRSAGICIESASESDIEKILDYIELVREFEFNKLFFMVNMRSYFSDETMKAFIQTVLSHEYRVLLIESTERRPLELTTRHLVDSDLCEI